MSSTRASGVQIAWLDGGQRLHLQHGPIDLLIEAVGESAEVQLAYQRAIDAFDGLLEALVTELNILRQPMQPTQPGAQAMAVSGPVARRMWEAASRAARFGVTPMIAVAGAVADHVLEAAGRDRTLERLSINNGGDIALWLADRASCTVGICANSATGELSARCVLMASDGVNGIATSGWRGRSHSLGIADAVTVLAPCAAVADTAATLIANAVDLPGHAAVKRQPACELSPDSDLGSRPVTTAVGELSASDIAWALHAGRRRAEELVHEWPLFACYLHLQGDTVVAEHPRWASRRRQTNHTVDPVFASPEHATTPLAGRLD